MLTACLRCGWVHGFPWSCPNPTAKRDRVFRVGKANTLLLTPNDWSTLGNGTVDGEPTGLHRFVGENRFVFVLLNVTDGHGDLVSYDLESRTSEGNLADQSGNGLYAYHFGVTLEPARFGLGARLDGTANSALWMGDDETLNDVNDALTVSFWIRPDVDYGTGTTTGWRWSSGRQDLWRFGYYEDMGTSFHGLRFEVKDTGGTVRAVQAAYPLYAGRWVHLAATLTRRENFGGYTWSDLDLYANGVRIWSQTVSPYVTAMDGTTSLYLGYDTAGGGRFKGIVDEFRLYKTSLSQDSVRGLAWFLHGANNVIVPRGVFFDSKLFASLNASAYDPDSPLAGANVNGNDNKGTASLNARVIQMVITKNATLAQAWKVLDLAATNTTGSVTAFALFVTNEFYTLGLAKEVRDLTANVVVENSGNFSAPPPSPTLWQLFWNTVAGIAGAAWNALAAVGAFFANVAKWLVDAFVGVLIGLVTGNWTYFQENVLEPLREALEALFKFIFDLVKALFQAVIDELSGLVGRFFEGFDGFMRFSFPAYMGWHTEGPQQAGSSPDQSPTASIGRALVALLGLVAPLMALITLIFYAMVAVEIATKPLPFVAVIMVAIASLIIVALTIALLATEGPAELGGAPNQVVQRAMGWENLYLEATFGAILLGLLVALFAELSAGKGIAFIPLAQALIGFLIIGAGEKIYRGTALLLSDLIGFVFLVFGAIGREDLAKPPALAALDIQTRWLAPITRAWDLATRLVVAAIGIFIMGRHYAEGFWLETGVVEPR